MNQVITRYECAPGDLNFPCEVCATLVIVPPFPAPPAA